MRSSIAAVLFLCLSTVALAAEEPIRVACVGDSITFGTSIQPPNKPYPAVLGTLLGKGYTVGNFGCGGTMIQDGKKCYLMAPQYEQGIEFGPQIVVLMLGANDAMFGMDTKEEIAAIEPAARTLVKRYTSLPSVVLICLPTPFVAKEPAEEKSVARTAQLNQNVALLIEIWRKIAASEKLQVIDTNTALTGKPTLFSDGVHPNADGAKLIAGVVAPFVVEAVIKLPSTPRVTIDPMAEIGKLTSARTKVVWTRSLLNPFTLEDSFFQASADLMCFDTAEGHERVLLAGPGPHYRPVIAPDGGAVLYNVVADIRNQGKMETSVIRAVNWDGTNDRALGKGFVLAAWRDPSSFITWVYAADKCKGQNQSHGMGYGELIRFPLDDPAVREVMLKRVPVNTSFFSLSADGTHAGGGFPWSNLGVAVLPDRGWQWYGSGFGGCIAPDNSYRFMHMGFPHSLQQDVELRGVNMYDDGGGNRRGIEFKGPDWPVRDDGFTHESFRGTRWSNDVRFLTTYTGGNAQRQQAIYLGRFNERFDAVEAWARVTAEPGHVLDPSAWIDPGVGRFEGEAPLTAAFLPPPAAGEWEWDYGDGAKDKATRGKHQYAKPGVYSVIARQSGTSVTGTVSVKAHEAPAVTATAQLDLTHLWVSFSKRVKLDGAKVELVGGPAVKAARLRAEENEAVIELASPLMDDAKLSLQGVTDKAEQPLPLAQATVPVVHRAWPANADGLMYRFANNNEPNVFWRTTPIVYDGETGPFVQRVELQPCGNVGFDRDGAMLCAGGWFANVLSRYYTIWWMAAQSKELTLEATIRPADLKQGLAEMPATFLAFHYQPRRRLPTEPQSAISLKQQGATLRVFFRTKSTVPAEKGKPAPLPDDHDVALGDLPDSGPHHIMVSYKPGNLVCYLDGKVLSQTSTITGELNDQPAADPNMTIPCNITHYFSLGHDPQWRAASPWRGLMENVAMYSRFVTAEEAARNAAVCLKAVGTRAAASPIVVEATLSAASTPPAVEKLGAYSGGLIVHEYTVDKVVSGVCAAKTIRVLHWSWRSYTGNVTVSGVPCESLHALPITAAQPKTKLVLALDSRDGHPELDRVLTVDTLAPAPGVPLFVENELAGLSVAPDRFKPLLDMIGVMPYEPPPVPTESTSLRSLPASGKVVVDGKTDDWDLSGGIFVCGDVAKRRDTQSAWVHVMHDAENLYLLARWRDETPLNNPKDTRKDKDGYSGDCLQFRLLAEPNTPKERCTHLTCWRGSDGGDAVEIVYGRKFDQVCSTEDRAQHATSQAFARSPDGKGYIQEIAIPWALLTVSGKPPATAMATVEINFTGPSGRVSTSDLLKAGSVAAGVSGFNNVDKWGALTLEVKGSVAPQPARLSDGRTFPVTAVPGDLTVDWKGLTK